MGRYAKQPWARTVSLADVAALVELVRESAVRGAREGLEALAATVPVPIAGGLATPDPRRPGFELREGRRKMPDRLGG
jgi:hypothetical protein